MDSETGTAFREPSSSYKFFYPPLRTCPIRAPVTRATTFGSLLLCRYRRAGRIAVPYAHHRLELAQWNYIKPV